ncbi:MAG: HAD family phosphatase [Saprospiraceae bacterium]|nr:HAD family phosphatase [Saprospiraceae bacterium]
MIKNIIFDFGNVLFDLDLPATERKMRLFLGDSFEPAVQQLRHDRVFELYETGGLSTEEFIERLRFAGSPVLTTDQVTDAWHAIFIGMPAARFEWLLRLRQLYKVFLLSNINDLHARWIDEYMLREYALEGYENRYFDGVYFSHLIRLRKPDPTIYEYVLADAEILPDETLFFDDLEVNISSARNLGIHAYLHTPGAEIIDHCNRVLSDFTTGQIPSRQ